MARQIYWLVFIIIIVIEVVVRLLFKPDFELNFWVKIISTLETVNSSFQTDRSKSRKTLFIADKIIQRNIAYASSTGERTLRP